MILHPQDVLIYYPRSSRPIYDTRISHQPVHPSLSNMKFFLLLAIAAAASAQGGPQRANHKTCPPDPVSKCRPAYNKLHCPCDAVNVCVALLLPITPIFERVKLTHIGSSWLVKVCAARAAAMGYVRFFVCSRCYRSRAALNICAVGLHTERLRCTLRCSEAMKRWSLIIRPDKFERWP